MGKTHMDPFTPGGLPCQAPVLAVNLIDSQPYEISGATYVFTAMDECTCLQDLGLLFSPLSFNSLDYWKSLCVWQTAFPYAA